MSENPLSEDKFRATHPRVIVGSNILTKSSIVGFNWMRSDTDKSKIEQLMLALGGANLGPGRIYFTGGATAVLFGWRQMTVDVDFKLDPEPAGLFAVLPKLKNELDLNIDPAVEPKALRARLEQLLDLH